MNDTISRADALAAIEAIRNDWNICPPCIDEALAAINALPAKGWQPIETAPKDGTWFIAVCDNADQPIPSETWWDGAWVHYSRRQPGMKDGLYEYHPTRWMPLPDAP